MPGSFLFRSAIFGYKDQVNMDVKDTVSAVPYIVIFLHRPTIIAGMKRLQAYIFELRPDGAQQRDMHGLAGACRFVFNRVLAWQKDRYATLSDGSYYAPLNSFRRRESALIKAQRAMSRKQKFSNNWKKAKAKVQNIHARIGNARRDYLHKATITISQNHAMVCIEDLQVRNMSRSAAGTLEAPCRRVRAKSGLNKSILDQGWYEFRRQLDYKLAWNGGQLIVVPPQNTSRTCPRCDHISKDNRKTQAQFLCVECGLEENADLVGAINVLRAGHARIACADTSPEVGASGQEPTEATQAACAA